MRTDTPATHRHWLPLLAVPKRYPRVWLRHDIVAGLSACVVMIPLVLAYAELVHLPPVTGSLYAALAACVVMRCLPARAR